jgi:hypothetical protein
VSATYGQKRSEGSKMKKLTVSHGWFAAGLGACGLAVIGCGKPTASTPPPTSGRKPVAGVPKTPTPPVASKITFTKPEYVRGIYVTAWSAGSKTGRARLLTMLDHTELNTMVIDVRDDGDMYWKNSIPLAAECKANQNAITKPELVLGDIAKHHVWPIARIACFRDHWVPKKHPELAVQLVGGHVWSDRSKHTWLDPYNKKNWEYIAQTVDFALDQGFPAIQLDYVRFPSEGKSDTQRFPAQSSYPDKKAKHEDVIAAFAHFIRERVKARGAEFSADNFGIISSGKSDQGIGQELEKLAEPFDVMSPMVYPSHFAKGEYRIPDPNAAPYEIISHSLGDYKKRLPQKSIRPWLQDFDHYGVEQIHAEIKAAYQLGYREYLIWNAGNHFTEAAYKNNDNLLKKGAAPSVSPGKSPAKPPIAPKKP